LTPQRCSPSNPTPGNRRDGRLEIYLVPISKHIVTKAKIVKIDEEQRNVFGIFSVAEANGAPVVDHEDDSFTGDELEKAAYNHVLEARIAGENHVRKGVGDLIESVVFTEEKCAAMVKCLAETGITATIEIPAVAWWGGYHVHDDAVWKAVKAGEYVSWSIGGSADRAEAA
jgi:hypothetical protein